MADDSETTAEARNATRPGGDAGQGTLPNEKLPGHNERGLALSRYRADPYRSEPIRGK